MIQFHETLRGKIFFEHQLPSLINAINRLADAVQTANETLNQKNESSETTISENVK